MEAFGVLTAIGAPLPRDNVDTEVIIPIRRLMAFPRGQLGPYCFEPWRGAPGAAADRTFVLDGPRYRGARILVTGANFGCGSSREAAVWALWDMGFRCILAESFGDIFQMNCFHNGLLPITLDRERIEALLAELSSAEEPTMTVDLPRQLIVTPAGRTLGFTIEAERRTALLDGLDDIGLTLRYLTEIRQFEERDAALRPWIYAVVPRT